MLKDYGINKKMVNQEINSVSITNKKWQELLLKHKKSIGINFKETDLGWLIPKIIDQSERLCLFYADFKCQACSSTSFLTFHHCINRYTKNFVDKTRYLLMRYYWQNILVLCINCHYLIEGKPQKDLNLLKNQKTIIWLNPNKISKIRVFFGDKN